MLVVVEELLKVLPPNSTTPRSAGAADFSGARPAPPSKGHDPAILDSAVAGLVETWPEALLLLLAMVLYFLLERVRHRLLQKRQKAAAAKPSGRGLGVVKLGACTQGSETQRFVLSTVQRGGKCGPESLHQYDLLARGPLRAELQRCLQQEDRARPFFAALIAAATREAAAAQNSGDSAPRTWTARLLADMRSLNLPRSRELYAAGLRLFSGKSLFREALWLHDVMVADGHPPDREALVCLLHAAVALGEGRRALFFFRESARQGRPSMRTCMTVLRVFAGSQDWEGAVSFLKEMKAVGAKPDALVLNTVLGVCVAANQLREAGKVLLDWEESTDRISCNIVLKGYAQQACLPEAQALLDQMLEKGPEPNIITFNTVLDCNVRAMQLHAPAAGKTRPAGGKLAALAARPWELLEQILALGLRPDRYTCSTLVKGMHLAGCTSRQLDLAVELLRQVGPEGLQAPSAGGASCRAAAGANGGEPGNGKLVEVIFNTLLDACASLQDLERMSQVFGMMEAFGVAISAVTFGTLIKAFGQAKSLTHCREAWQRMRAAGVAPTVVTFGCYIDACLRAGDVAGAEEAFRSMREAGVRPNAVVYTSLIRGFAQAKQPRRALELYGAMRDEGIEATTMTFNTVLNVLAVQLPDHQTLMDVVSEMHRMGIPPDVVTYSILIKASCNAGHLDGALWLLRELRQHGLAADGVAFNTLLLACSRSERISEAEEVFAEMRRSKVEPTHVTASILVKMYGRARLLDRAEEVSELIERDHGRAPNLHVYTCLIQACVQNKQVRRSWEIFHRMLRAGVQPDAITYGTMVHGCIYHNKFEVAMELVRHAHRLPRPSQPPRDPPQLALGELHLEAPVPLQPEVLKSLHGALQRKALHGLVAELERAGLVAAAAERSH